jgi:hypothetical protein
MEEEDQSIMEHVLAQQWSKVRTDLTERGTNISLALVNAICSVNPPQSVIIAIHRANSRIFSEMDEKGRHPLHYLCYYGAPTYAIVYAAQCHIAALEQADSMRKTPFEYLMTMAWEFVPQDKPSVVAELQKCHSLKCYDATSKMANKIALETWGHKVVLEENIECFAVLFAQCARSEHAEDFEGCCVSPIAKEIREACHDANNAVTKEKEDVICHIDPYRLDSNNFVIVVKTQNKKDLDYVYDRVCNIHLASLTHCGIYLRLGCIYTEAVVGSKTLMTMVEEADELQQGVKAKLEDAAAAVSMALDDIKGERIKINVSPLTKSRINDLVGKKFVPDKKKIQS